MLAVFLPRRGRICLIGGMRDSIPFVALPERFNQLEAMLFATGPGDVRRAAERYAGDLLSRPVAPPRLSPAVTLLGLPTLP